MNYIPSLSQFTPNKKHMKKVIVTFTFAVLAGCANTGAKFNSANLERSHTNQALVYFYRPSGFIGGGGSFPIVANDTDMGSLDNGAYFKRTISPGAYKIHSDTGLIDRISDFNFEGGKTYFIKAYVDAGVWISSIRFISVYQEKALREMSETGIQIETN